MALIFDRHVRPANERKVRKDRRKKANQSGKRRSVVVTHERNGSTKTAVNSNEAQGVSRVVANVCEDQTIHEDEASPWDQIAARLPTKRFNHQNAYSKVDVCTNQAESFFNSMRRVEIGIHHHIAGNYLQSDASEMAFHEDARRESNRTHFLTLVGASINAATLTGCADTGKGLAYANAKNGRLTKIIALSALKRIDVARV